MPETKATLRYLRTSPTKVREVLGLIRGLEVAEARHVLQFSERGPARDVLKVLNSAVANADHTLNIPPDELYVSIAFADEGPTIKRWRPRARGRATRIRKRTSHVTIVVARLSDEQLQARRRRETAPGQRRRGVLPGRRRRAGEQPAPGGRGVSPKGTGAPEKAAPAPEPEAPPAPSPVEAPEAGAVESDDDLATRYATLGREVIEPGEAEPGEPESTEDEEGK